jgi:serine/threonine-protein kinase
MNDNGVDRDAVQRQLERVLASTPFRQAERSAGLLRYLVDRSLSGAGDRVKEYTVGVEALGRGTDFDPRTDPIVRAEASRVRGRLERYYAGEGQADPIVIDLPKGAYTVRFSNRDVRPELPSPPEPDPPSRRRIRELTLGTLAVLAVVAAGVWGARSAPVALSPLSLDARLQTDELIASDVGTDVVISPDGLRVAFVSIDSLGATHQRLLTLDSTRPVDQPGTVGGRGAFWSPDSKWIGFWAAGELRKVSVEGGAPVVLCRAPDLLGASRADDGSIIASINASARLVRISGSSGGEPVTVLNLTSANVAPRWPQVLPGGKEVLYTAIGADGIDRATIEVASLTDGTRRVLVEGGTFGRYVAPQYLTFVNQGTLYAIKFNARTLEVHGDKAPILTDVAYSSTFGYAQLSVSGTGVAMYRSAVSSALVVALVDSTGKRTPVLDAPGQYSWPSVSPDGERLALGVVESGVTNLSMFTNLHGRPRFAWKAPGLEGAAWSRDGRYVLSRGSRGIEWLSALGGEAHVLIPSTKIQVPWTFSPGDKRLAFAVMDTATAFDLWTAPIVKEGDTLRAGKATPLLRTPVFEVYPAISQDGNWLAYWSNESGSPVLYVRSLADTSIKEPIAAGGGVPRWSRTGRRLFYTRPDHRLMVVDYSVTGRQFIPGRARLWTSVRFADTGVLPNYDLYDDDRHVVALLPLGADDSEATHVNTIVGLPERLRQKLP